MIDAFMMFTVFGGFAFCAAYFRAQYMDWRQKRSSDLEKQVRARLLYQVGTSRVQKAVGAGAGTDPRVGGLAGSLGRPSAESPVDRYLTIAQPRLSSKARNARSVLSIDRAVAGLRRWME